MRLIDADELNKRIFEDENCYVDADGYVMMRRIHIGVLIDEAPTVDAVTVVHGHWIHEYDELGIDRGWKCSACRCSVYEMTYEPYVYCPHCGAKLLEEESLC